MTEQLITETPQAPASDSGTAAEYVAIREQGAGVIDMSSRGRISVGGLEAVEFLNGLITNDMKTLAEDTWMPAVFPNVQGRLIASARVIRFKDIQTDKNVCPSYLIDTETATHNQVLTTLQRFTLAGDFRVTDLTSKTAQFSVQGPDAKRVTQSVLGDAVTNLDANGAAKIKWQENEVSALRASHTGANGFDLIIQATASDDLWRALVSSGATRVGDETLEILRIEAGLPRYGIDMDETNVVTETNLDHAVSYTKGCYIGQEIIARIKYRGHVAKKLVGLSFADKVDVAPGDVIRSSHDKDIGRITSATYSPQLKRTIALGYVKYDYLAAGTGVKVIHDGSDVSANVTELPFV